MARMPIKIYDDPILREVAQPIARIDERLRQIAQDMVETMYESRGIGLAANQVGLTERIIVVDVNWSEKRGGKGMRNPTVMFNPEVLEESVADEADTEGCLSLPDIEGSVWRSLRIRYRYLDLQGKTVEAEAVDLQARCILHELDHLNGVLFIDRMAPAERERLAGKLAILRQTRKAMVG